MDREYLSDSIKRAVRQRCHFGCIICGIPIFDYDHIEPYSATRVHEEENIVLLCPHHHSEKTRGRISISTIRKKSLKPFNRNQSLTSRTKIGLIEPDIFCVKLGKVLYKYDARDAQTYPVLNIECLSYISFTREDDELLPSIAIPDGKGGVFLLIEKGEVRVSTGSWDYNLVGRLLVIKSSAHDTVVTIRYADEYIEIQKCRIVGAYGTDVQVTQEKFSVTQNNVLSEVLFGWHEARNKCLVITFNEVSLTDVSEFGFVSSRQYDKCFFDILKRIDLIEDSNLRLMFLYDLNDRSVAAASGAVATDKLLEGRVNLASKILDILQHSDKLHRAKAEFNLGVSLMHRARRSRSKLMARESLAHFKRAQENFTDGYTDLERAQVLANVARSTELLVELGENLSKAEITYGLEAGAASLNMYKNQGQRFTGVMWPNTNYIVQKAVDTLEYALKHLVVVA